jgi:DNA-binding transcriptional LysR family regulator
MSMFAFCQPVSALALTGNARFKLNDDGNRCRAVSADNHHVAQLENFRLQVFRAVAEQLSFRKAAEQLFLTQPAVTLQIKALEEDLGVRLFNRVAGRVSLTTQGALLLRHAQQIAAMASEAQFRSAASRHTTASTSLACRGYIVAGPESCSGLEMTPPTLRTISQNEKGRNRELRRRTRLILSR